MSTPTIASAPTSVSTNNAPGQSPCPAVQVSSERTKEELELAERLIEHSQGARLNPRESTSQSQTQATATTPTRPQQTQTPSGLTQSQKHTPRQATTPAQGSTEPRRYTPLSTDGESRSGGDVDVDDPSRISDGGTSPNQNLSLPSIHELTWVKQRKPFNTGMGGAGQVCRYVSI